MAVYTATVKLGTNTHRVTVEASTQEMAKAMLEAQYGRGSLIVNPSR